VGREFECQNEESKGEILTVISCWAENRSTPARAYYPINLMTPATLKAGQRGREWRRAKAFAFIASMPSPTRNSSLESRRRLATAAHYGILPHISQ
jgi:hypothetical protein